MRLIGPQTILVAVTVAAAWSGLGPALADGGGADAGAATETLPPATSSWSVAASAYAYIVRDDSDYLQPTITADRSWLHLEARYNYEALDTASVWAGVNLNFGNEVTLAITPMIGAVFGDIDGVAPGYEFTLGWCGIELSSEGEYVVDLETSSESFFYTWTTLTYSPNEYISGGIAIQRTQVYETDFDIQRGLYFAATYRWLELSAAVLNPDDDLILILGVQVTIDF